MHRSITKYTKRLYIFFPRKYHRVVLLHLLCVMGKLFGTDGIRGVTNISPMTGEFMLKIAVKISSYLRGKLGSEHKPRVIISKDTRISCYLFESALTAGFISAGCDVMLAGPLPTPALTHLIVDMRANLGVMISASHNPYQDNGIKLFDSDGCKLSHQAQSEIEDYILSEGDAPSDLVETSKLGKVSRIDDAGGRYIEKVKSCVPRKIWFNSKKIVIDCANGAGYRVAPKILWELGAETHVIHDVPNGLNINLGCGTTDPASLSAEVLKQDAYLGIALDGDGDRFVAVDEKGKVLSTEHMLAFLVEYYIKQAIVPIKSVVVTHMMNSAIDVYLSSLGVQTHRCDVGDINVYSTMVKYAAFLGAEPSGHIIFREHNECSDGTLSALQFLTALLDFDRPVSDIHYLFELVPSRARNIALSGDISDEFISSLRDRCLADYEVKKAVIRKSGTESKLRVLIEGDADKIDAALAYIEAEVAKLNG